MHLSKTRRRLFTRILEPLVVALLLKLGQFRVQYGLLLQEVVSPDVGFENGVDGFCVISDDL